MKKPLFQVIAAQVARRASAANVITVHPSAMRDAEMQIAALVKDYMPSGSGIDCGTTLDADDCTNGKLVFKTAFHHMDQHGGYDGWTNHDVIVSPSLQWDFDLRITGKNRNDIKDYLYEVFNTALKQVVEDGTMFVRREDEAIEHLRAVLPHVVESDAGEKLDAARVFINRVDGDYSK